MCKRRLISAALHGLSDGWNHRCALQGSTLLHQRQQLSLPPSICENSVWNVSMRKRGKEALLTPDKIKWEGGEGWREGCSMVCVCVASILRGLKCGCKTLMIPRPLTKRPRHRHSTHIKHCQSCISWAKVKRQLHKPIMLYGKFKFMFCLHIQRDMSESINELINGGHWALNGITLKAFNLIMNVYIQTLVQ